MPEFDNRNPPTYRTPPTYRITTAPPTAPRRAAPSTRTLFRLGATQMIITIVVVIVLNVVARRLGLGLTGSIVLCAAVALAWPFVAAWFRRR